MDEWAYIPGFPLYSVNALGQVQNNDTGAILRPQKNDSGLVFVGMVDEDGEQRQRGLARMVAKAFLPQEIPIFNTPINVDGDRWNCDVENLLWRPRWFAIRYHMQFSQRYPFPIDVPLRDLESDEIYNNSWHVCTTHGLLEKDLVLSVELRTYVWPTYQRFDLAE